MKLYTFALIFEGRFINDVVFFFVTIGNCFDFGFKFEGLYALKFIILGVSF